MFDLNKLSAEERASLTTQLLQEEKENSKKRDQDIITYKAIVSANVDSLFPMLQKKSEELSATKKAVYDLFEAAFALKADLFPEKDSKKQLSHTFMNAEGTQRITLGVNVIDNYDDTADNGISMINEYLDELSSSREALQAVVIARSLLAKDKKGTLKASRIMSLRQLAIESQSTKFIKGIEIIMNAYKPIPTKQYIKAEFRDEKGKWLSVPLGITEA